MNYAVLEEVVTALGVLVAAKPYLDKIAELDATGASGEDILAAVRGIRTASEAAAQAAIDKA